MQFFQTDFYRNSLKVHEDIKKQNILPTTFPNLEFVMNGDKFYKKLWKKVDEADTYVWLLTYTMDDSYTANLTMLKLIEASKRGVKVVLLVDDLNNKVNKTLRVELEQAGGVLHSLNKVSTYFWTLDFNRGMFCRHHEKAAIIDDTAFIGSANIADNYGGYIYGTNDFYDLNAVLTNTCLSDTRKLIYDTVNQYKLQLDNKFSNDQILKQYEEQYKDSIFNSSKVYMLKSTPPEVEDIQDFIINSIDKAEKSIYIIQPYYYPVRAFEQAIIRALERGVYVEIITAHKRDQPAYASLKNLLMMKKMVYKGLQVYELHDRLLHMKAYLFDDSYYTMGSFNNDRWSWVVNNEANIVVESPQEAVKMKRIIDIVREKSKLIDSNLEMNWYRFLKIKFWKKFLFSSENSMGKKKLWEIETRLKTYAKIHKNPEVVAD